MQKLLTVQYLLLNRGSRLIPSKQNGPEALVYHLKEIHGHISTVYVLDVSMDVP